MGFVFCALGVLAFSAFYLLVDRSQKRKNDAMGLNLATFLTGAVLSVAAAGGVRAEDFPSRLLVVGLLIGVTAGIGLLGITLAVRTGASITIVNTAMSLSLCVPIVLSLALYGEHPGPRKTAGLALAGLSIVLMQKGRK